MQCMSAHWQTASSQMLVKPSMSEKLLHDERDWLKCKKQSDAPERDGAVLGLGGSFWVSFM